MARDLYKEIRDGDDANLLGLDTVLKRWRKSGHVQAPKKSLIKQVKHSLAWRA